MYGKRLISCLPKICSHEFLEPSTTWPEKSIDVSFVFVLFSVCEFTKFNCVSSERMHTAVNLEIFVGKILL